MIVTKDTAVPAQAPPVSLESGSSLDGSRICSFIMSRHLGFGYVDVPPLVPSITLLPRLLIGNALWAYPCAHFVCGQCKGIPRVKGASYRV
jgi:hypothetical protein